MIAHTSDILRRFAAHGVHLSVHGSQIQVKGRASGRVIKRHKRELIAALAGRHSDVYIDLPGEPTLSNIGAGFLLINGERVISTPTGDDPLIDLAFGLVSEAELIAVHEGRTRQGRAMEAAWKHGRVNRSEIGVVIGSRRVAS